MSFCSPLNMHTSQRDCHGFYGILVIRIPVQDFVGALGYFACFDLFTVGCECGRETPVGCLFNTRTCVVSDRQLFTAQQR